MYGPVAGVPSGFELYMLTLAVSDPPNCRMSVSTVESVYPFSLSPVVNCCARLSSKAPTVPVSYSALAFVGWPASFTRVAAGFSSSTATDVTSSTTATDARSSATARMLHLASSARGRPDGRPEMYPSNRGMLRSREQSCLIPVLIISL